MQADWTVYVVDDDAAVREALCWLISSVDLAVESYASAHQFLDAFVPSGPSCLVLDLRMPGMSGTQLQQELANLQLDIPIIIISGHADVAVAVQVLKAGAVDLLEKPFSDQALLDRIRLALEHDARARQVGAHQAALQARFVKLTGREKQILKEAVAGRLNKQIADELGIAVKTVEFHRANIMQKLQADSFASLVRMSDRVGIPSGKP